MASSPSTSKTEDDLAAAFARMRERIDAMTPRPHDVAFLVQEFVAGGVEVFAGISRDPDFGLSIAFGLGGTAIEVTRDFALRMLPLREGDAEAMIAETRAAAMLGAVRGRPAADIEEPRRLPLRAVRFRRGACRDACRGRPQSDQGAAERLRRGRCPDRGGRQGMMPWAISASAT